jgi:putative phosphoesterase
MKLLIASDIHGSAEAAKALQEIFAAERPDKLVLLGDLLYHGPRNPLPQSYDPPAVAEILNNLARHIVAVRGNCDAEVDQIVLNFPMWADYAVLYVDGRTMYATHGHLHGPENPPLLVQGDILLCGHTHIGAAQRQNAFLYLNPGSIALPKDGHYSYMVYKDGEVERKNLAGEVLERVEI